MGASKVYYMNDRAVRNGEAVQFKALKVLRDAGLQEMIKEGDIVGIKVHTGSYGNSANLRPGWITPIIDEVKRLGAQPVLIESNFNINGFGGDRQTTSMHKKIVNRHGMNEQTLECPVWLPEEEMDIEGVRCPVPNGVILKETYLASNMVKCDKVIVVSHFKGHMQGVFGGAIKNVGIGMCSCKGKSCAHLVNHPTWGLKTRTVNQDAVKQFMQFPHPNPVDGIVAGCSFGALELDGEELKFHPELCQQCSACYYPAAFMGLLNTAPELFGNQFPAALTDSAAGIINHYGAENMIYLNYAFDITPGCDCGNFHDAVMIPNLGVFASKDPVALDMACLEASEASLVVPGSAADVPGISEPNSDRFTNISSMTKSGQWIQINAGVYNGIGTSEYDLVESEALEDWEVASWLNDEGPGNPIGKRCRDIIQKANFQVQELAYEQERVPMDELLKRPAGLQAQMNIKDL